MKQSRRRLRRGPSEAAQRQPQTQHVESPAEAAHLQLSPERGLVVDGDPLAHPTARPSRLALMAAVQRHFGNAGAELQLAGGPLARSQGASTAGPLLSRQATPDAPAAAPAQADPAALPGFDFAERHQEGERFDSSYTPVGPSPAVGTLDINLFVHITFAPFTREMMRQEPYRAHRFTPAQLADFAWTDGERERFETDFMTSVGSAWSGKHTMRLNEPGFAEHRCQVNVNVLTISEPGMAHTAITAQKVPAGAPRFRSFVQGNTATLDIRDPTENETHKVLERKLVRQVRPFDLGSAEINSTIDGQIRGIEDELRRDGITPGAQADGSALEAVFRGRASSSGGKTLNQNLGQQRAQAVRDRIAGDMGWGDLGTVSSAGEENASNGPNFRRVDISIRNPSPIEVSQNVAAHEAGHMFGLGDEYVEEKPKDNGLPKFFGDEPTHYGDVQAHIGTDAANDLLNQQGTSIMSMGGTVQRGHYVFFLEALSGLTGKRWNVE